MHARVREISSRVSKNYTTNEIKKYTIDFRSTNFLDLSIKNLRYFNESISKFIH